MTENISRSCNMYGFCTFLRHLDVKINLSVGRNYSTVQVTSLLWRESSLLSQLITYWLSSQLVLILQPFQAPSVSSLPQVPFPKNVICQIDILINLSQNWFRKVPGSFLNEFCIGDQDRSKLDASAYA